MSWPSTARGSATPTGSSTVPRRAGRRRHAGAGADERAAAGHRPRDDGYVQDASSQWVAAAVEVDVGARVLDVCAAPGGKATAMAAAGARVIAADQRLGRAAPRAENAATLDLDLPVVVADGAAPPFRPGSFDPVLLDAPCSGLGALRRRADARWRIQPSDIAELAALQARLLASAAALVAPAVGSSTACARSPRRSRSTTAHLRASRSTRRRRRSARGDRSSRAGGCCPTTPTPTAWC